MERFTQYEAMERLKYHCSWGNGTVPSLGKNASTGTCCNEKITYSVIQNPRQNPAENFGQVFPWQRGNVFLWHYLIFPNFCKVTISHLISGRIKSDFISMCLLTVWKHFYNILHRLKNQLLSFSLRCVITMLCGKTGCAVSLTGSVIRNLSAPCILPLVVFTAHKMKVSP